MELNEEVARDLLARFSDFGDAVIRLIEIRVEASEARIELDAKDGSADWAWRRVRFEFEEVSEWRFERNYAATEVVFEANALVVDGVMFLSFDGPSHDGVSTVEDFRKSLAYIAARRAKCEIDG